MTGDRSWTGRLKDWTRRLKEEMVALWFCTRHPRTPFAAKALALALVVYAFSPIDLIPDFIPVLGFVDDLLLLSVGIWIVVKLVPGDVLAECREQAARWLEEKRPEPKSYLGAAFIVVLWLVALWLAWLWTGPWLAG